MSEEPLDAGQAGGVVHARLGRPPQDLLEAVVVLEAWGGVPTLSAFGVGGAVLAPDALPAATQPDRSTTPADGERESVVAESIALLVAILAIAAWAGPLSSAIGASVLARALEVALPVTLALQWMLRSRYLSRRAGLRCLLEDRFPLALLAIAIGAGLALLPGAGPIAGAFVAIWVAGTLIARRGWGLVYAGLVLGEAVALAYGAPARGSLAILAGVTLLGAGLAIATSGTASEEELGRLGRALAAAAIGALLGGMLVADTSLGWGVRGAFPALALVPSVVGSCWGGFYLWQFHEAIPRGLRGVPLAQASERIARGPAARIVAGALVRLVGVTVLLSLLVIVTGEWTRGTDRTSLFVAFGCAALVCLFVSLHESLGFVRWAFLSAAAALVVELAVRRWLPAQQPGAALVAGATVGTVLALAPLTVRLRSSGRLLGTALWIR
jgi:hypothetical protein